MFNDGICAWLDGGQICHMLKYLQVITHIPVLLTTYQNHTIRIVGIH